MALALAGRRPIALALVAVPLLYWQVAPAIRDVSDASGDPSVERAYHAPLVREVDSLVAGTPARIHVVPTRNRWEAVHVGERYPLARGWLRQAESDDFDLFDDGNLTEDAYLAWLEEHAVSYIAVPHRCRARLPRRGRGGADRVRAAVPRGGVDEPELGALSRHRRRSLVSTVSAPEAPASDARLAALGGESFELTADEAGSYLVRVHHTPYWHVVKGEACIGTEGEWTRVDVSSPSVVAVRAELGLGDGSGC